MISPLRYLRFFKPPFSLMSRRSHSASPSPRPQKRTKLDHLSLDDFKNGVFLAPMVRSGTRKWLHLTKRFQIDQNASVPTRLFALKHGATMVWGPEIIDKAILHATRDVDRESLCAIYNFY